MLRSTRPDDCKLPRPRADVGPRSALAVLPPVVEEESTAPFGPVTVVVIDPLALVTVLVTSAPLLPPCVAPDAAVDPPAFDFPLVASGATIPDTTVFDAIVEMLTGFLPIPATILHRAQ